MISLKPGKTADPPVSPLVQPGEKAEPSKEEKKQSNQDVEAAKMQRVHSQYSTKAQDFQVRVKVVEARQVQGANIDTVCQVVGFRSTKQTRIIKASNAPQWNEVFYFNINMSPANMATQVITFSVYNAHLIRANSLIGSFNFDCANAYDAPQHSLINQWVLLADPNDPVAGAKGYLKVSVAILGPGDEAPSFKSSSDENTADIESKLLRPAGVSLRPASFIVSIYAAEDLPQMDSGRLNRLSALRNENTERYDVDPYVHVCFAGKSLNTEVVKCSRSPKWNEQLNMCFMFPSMCDRLKLVLFDWDSGSDDDPIATFYLDLSQCSSQGTNGFLPTLGPCYINFYGSPREYTDLASPLDDLNLGQAPGVAYRGRVLLQLETVFLEEEQKANWKETVPKPIDLPKFQARPSYVLYANFLSATKMSECSKPVRFELSIGNYGNIHETDTQAWISVTPAMLPVSDGEGQWYMPWTSKKPACYVRGEFEDIRYRLYAVNLLERLAELVKRSMATLTAAKKLKHDPDRQAEMSISALERVITYLSHGLPNMDEADNFHVNELDKRLQAFRLTVLDEVKAKLHHLHQHAGTVDDILEEMDRIYLQIKSIAHEPQNSVPDVIIWLIEGKKRVAYRRIPAYEVLYARREHYRGRHCGVLRTINLKRPYCTEEERKANWEIPAQMQVMLWLGLETQEVAMRDLFNEAEIVFYAETFEFQEKGITGNWSAPTFPAGLGWGDHERKVSQPREQFAVAEGWRWDGEWFESMELAALPTTYDNRMKSRVYTTCVFEARAPTGEWMPDAGASEQDAFDSFQLERGWEWASDWAIDYFRNCDEDGWQYTINKEMAGFVSECKSYHLFRKRTYMRKCTCTDLDTSTKPEEKDDSNKDENNSDEDKTDSDRWEYDALFDESYTGRSDLSRLRRRRWYRKLARASETAALTPILSITPEADKSLIKMPRMLFEYSTGHRWQLRVCLYQARNLLAADATGFSDPYCRVSFVNRTKTTVIVQECLNPVWDQTLLFSEIVLYNQVETIKHSPPPVVVEVFDENKFSKDTYLGRADIHPAVHLTADQSKKTHLSWHKLSKKGTHGGDILAAFDLTLADDAGGVHLDSTTEKIPIPHFIRPRVQLMRIEILCWGVRNMSKFALLAVDHPSVEFNISDAVATSDVIKSAKTNSNFVQNKLTMEAELPADVFYMPPLNICVRDHRAFGNKPVVGTCTIVDLSRFCCAAPFETSVEVDEPANDSTAPPPHVAFAFTNEGFEYDEEEEEDEEEDEVAPGQQLEAAQPPPPLADLNSRRISSVHLQLPQQSLLLNQDKPVSKADPDGEAEEEEEGKKKKKKKKTGSWRFSTLKKKFSRKKEKKPDEKISKIFNWNFFRTCDGEKLDLSSQDANIDWWSKYYASIEQLTKCHKYEKMGYDKLEFYKSELEKVNGHEDFEDLCSTFRLSRGKTADGEDNFAGEFKGTFRIYPIESSTTPRYLDALVPKILRLDCIVRVYLVKATELTPIDSDGLADPYVRVRLGTQSQDSRDDYRSNNLNPEFGLMFEFKAMIPRDKDLVVQVMDHNMLLADELIGETRIDLENRLLSKFRAGCGLPQSYCLSGPCQWRDQQLPTEILAEFCHRNQLQAPRYESERRCVVGGRTFSLRALEKHTRPNPHLGPAKERLALHILRRLPLVKEHVERRKLYSPMQPSIEQGRLEMWVDLFPVEKGEPGPPFDISPRKPTQFQLRIIIWNTKDVILDETSITGEKMSDIYVKGWISGIDERQETDVHYRSLDGEGNFNWRFVFSFDYIPAENVIVINKKQNMFSLEKTEIRLKPMLILQVWDNDQFTADDFLGTLEMDLTNMPVPAKSASACTLKKMRQANTKEGALKAINLFECRRAYGFWPFINEESGEAQLTGKVEMEMEILTQEEADLKPAGRGRDKPNENPHLEPPNRPDTSFFWFTSPFKTLKYIVWKRMKWILLGILLILLLVLFIGLFIYSIPGLVAKKMIG